MINLSLSVTTITFAVLWTNSKSRSIDLDEKYAVENGSIGFPIRLPNDGKYLQWTFLQLNDVYELLPLDEGRRGGVARVARLRQLLLAENPHTFTVLAGDFLSPSALSQSRVNGSALNGKQMIAVFNTLGLDFVTFGNHEFDLTRSELLQRMNESKFFWICSNLFQNGTNQSFPSTIPYKIVKINEIKILLIGLVIDSNQPYVQIVNKTSLIPFVQQFLQSLSGQIKYDILIAITHLELETDIQLAANIPQIDLIFGGHEHENMYVLRGSEYIPIAKADANAFTVYIHRCAFNIDTKQLRVYPTLTKITPQIEDEPQTAQVANYWYDLGMKGFEALGFRPHQIVSCLPTNIVLDGRLDSVENFPTLLTDYACQSLLQTTSNDKTIVAMFNSGGIRVDDILKGIITQYDLLRVLPYLDKVFSLLVPGPFLANVLTSTVALKGTGMYPVYCGINTTDEGKTWFINGTDISRSNLNYSVAVQGYWKKTEMTDPTVLLLNEFNITHVQALINFLHNMYPPC